MLELDFEIVDEQYLICNITAEMLGYEIEKIWCPSPSLSHRTEPYDVPEKITIATWTTEHAGSKLTPTPFGVVVEGKAGRTFVAVTAQRGWYRWNYVQFCGYNDKLTVMVDLEGHTPPADALEHVNLTCIQGKKDEKLIELFERAIQQLHPPAEKKPGQADWWKRPIYCGWGDQVGLSLHLEGPGPEDRAISYCTQGLYERWLNRLEKAGVPIGTVIVDNGWSPAGVWTENIDRWPDMKGFIARQHEKGRKVLLWIATWLYEGLPDEWCIFCDGRKLVADPTCKDYLNFIAENIARLCSSANNGLDADGFKIDQLAYTPTTKNPRGGEQFGRTFSIENKKSKIEIAGEAWGCELLYLLQKHIYDCAKDVKPDALISSSTAHPYFRNSYDMIRLHDTGSVNVDPLVAMQARAQLARAVDSQAVIDADDWVHSDYTKWLDYTCSSYQIGVPCIFYAEHFVESFSSTPTTRTIPVQDLKRIANAWENVS